MKVALVAPDWGNSWKPSLKKMFEEKGHEVRWISKRSELWVVYQWADACLSMWADELAIEISHVYQGPFYTYIRAYEAFTDMPLNIKWDKVKGLFFCNNNTSKIVEKDFGDEIDKQNPNMLCHIIPNWIDVDAYPLKERENGTEIAMIADLNFKKNIPLALQIIAYLNTDYHLHIVGACQDESLMIYMANLITDLRMEKQVTLYDRIPHKKIPEFLDDKNYILSTSMREGCPMNILEAMAMGIKPIIHNWPGAKNIFPEDYVFSGINKIDYILNIPYDSQYYRMLIKNNHSLDNARKIVKIVTGEGD